MIVIFSEFINYEKFDFQIVDTEELINKIVSDDYEREEVVMFNSHFFRIKGTEFFFHKSEINEKKFYLGFKRSICEKYKELMCDEAINNQKIKDFYDFAEKYKNNQD